MFINKSFHFKTPRPNRKTFGTIDLNCPPTLHADAYVGGSQICINSIDSNSKICINSIDSNSKKIPLSHSLTSVMVHQGRLLQVGLALLVRRVEQQAGAVQVIHVEGFAVEADFLHAGARAGLCGGVVEQPGGLGGEPQLRHAYVQAAERRQVHCNTGEQEV